MWPVGYFLRAKLQFQCRTPDETKATLRAIARVMRYAELLIEGRDSALRLVRVEHFVFRVHGGDERLLRTSVRVRIYHLS